MSLVLTLRSSRTGSLVPGSIRTRVLAWMGKGIHARARTVVLKQLKLYRMFLDLGSAGAFGMPEEGRVLGGDKEVVFVRRAGQLSTFPVKAFETGNERICRFFRGCQKLPKTSSEP